MSDDIPTIVVYTKHGDTVTQAMYDALEQDNARFRMALAKIAKNPGLQFDGDVCAMIARDALISAP